MIEAAKLMTGALAVNSHDSFQVIARSLRPELEAIKTELEKFEEQHIASLPPAAAACLRQFLEQGWIVSHGYAGADIQAVVPFAVFRSGFDFLIHDTEVEARAITELAFEHLRRLLAVDSNARAKWAEAFRSGELQCEKLGAVHLLSHGIWAFKVSSIGAATDLVYGEPLENEAGLLRRTAKALVLTEWKLIQRANELESLAAQARHQARAYASGALADLELKQTRYIVLVTKDLWKSMPEIQEGNITYRHILLPVQPEVPSKAARRYET